jgi:hypothetical protein
LPKTGTIARFSPGPNPDIDDCQRQELPEKGDNQHHPSEIQETTEDRKFSSSKDLFAIINVIICAGYFIRMIPLPIGPLLRRRLAL